MNTLVGALQAIRDAGLWVRPVEQVKAYSDPDDNIFLECAQAARANVCGDRESQAFSAFVGRDQDCVATLAGRPLVAYWIAAGKVISRESNGQ